MQQLAKGTSQDEVTLSSEEIKPIALVVIELRLSEGIRFFPPDCPCLLPPVQKEHVLDNYLKLEINERRGLDSPKPFLLQS